MTPRNPTTSREGSTLSRSTSRGGRAASVRGGRSGSWYLDPVVARQKAAVFVALVERWRDPRSEGLSLKTDVFEEAHGEDALAPLLADRLRLVGVDVDLGNARKARRRFPDRRLRFLAGDLRKLGLRDSAFDLVISPSTLDHFATREELVASLREIHRVLVPRGTAVVILDNPRNPLYYPLRWLAPLVAPYALGRTLDARSLRRELESLGFDILGEQYVIHNPRGVLTLINLLLRALLGRFAERPIRGLVRWFAGLERLPTRRWSACFVAVGARKRAAAEAVPAANGEARR
jgi:SAM-dependent methyltransferase